MTCLAVTGMKIDPSIQSPPDVKYYLEKEGEGEGGGREREVGGGGGGGGGEERYATYMQYYEIIEKLACYRADE